jgi:hypothetical protein
MRVEKSPQMLMAKDKLAAALDGRQPPVSCPCLDGAGGNPYAVSGFLAGYVAFLVRFHFDEVKFHVQSPFLMNLDKSRF